VPCELSGIHLHAYLDGELDAAGSANFERHLQSCAQCAAALASQQALRQTLAASHLYEPAPARLRQRVRSSLPAALSPQVLKFQAWRSAALAAGLLLALLLGRELVTLLRGQSGGAVLAAATVDAHLRSLQPGHLTDVQSTDQHTVKPWFDGKIEFAPTVHDFANDGFPLVGGRLDVLAGRSVAVLVYARRKHIVNVFVMKPQSPQNLPGTGERQGYHWLSWKKDGLEYVAVSDVAPPDLQELRDLFLRE
jgi:mycothiol system anti-sigma-R factor